MLEKTITTVLFDLDGTLLPMDLDAFIHTYFGLLAQKAAPYGYEPKPLIDGVWKGMGAMIQNDGACPNSQRFWQAFCQEMGEEAAELQPVFDEFYAKEFEGARRSVKGNPLAAQAVKGLKGKGYTVILATNPVFPLVAVQKRLSWLGLTPEDFALVTSYENSNACKPNPQYYREILEKAGKSPRECLMVGNDAKEDLAARKAGLSVYLITDCLLNPQGLDLSGVPTGSFRDFMAYAGL